MSKCPKCENVITHLSAEVIPAHAVDGRVFEGAVFKCPLCLTILSAGIDPVLLTNQIIKEINKKK
jgi:hypothetical protein